ncbi:MAG TPA: ferredoxin [Burkholderiales bacterium]|nr:ferredoxin [Burkholderiales bacterium]
MNMPSEAQVTFFLTGRRAAEELAPLDAQRLRPASLAAYRDLTRLRYDFPLVLFQAPEPATGATYASLTALIDGVLAAAPGAGGHTRLRAHALKIEREIRSLVANGASGTLHALIDTAAARLAPLPDTAFAESVRQLHAGLAADGVLTDCTATLPRALLGHVWHSAQRAKRDAFGTEAERLILQLENILRADHALSRAGRSAEQLRAAVGSVHGEAFDFQRMAQLLAPVSAETTLSPARRKRIESVLEVLRRQRFFALPGSSVEPYAFEFEDCAAALGAFRSRLPEMTALARALAVGALEAESEYSEARHDALFASFGADGLAAEELARFPDLFVVLHERALHAPENQALAELLASGLPVKLLMQTDDLLEAPLAGSGHLALGSRARQFANMALGLNEVYIVQSASSNLVALGAHVERAMCYAGPALFSVYSGAGQQAGGLPPYLVAAAAMDARVFPAFTFDPSAGGDWATRFSLESNAQAERDWPLHSLVYEDAELQRIEEPVAFTLADFVACDTRHARHFAQVPREKWNGGMVQLEGCLGEAPRGLPQQLPSLMLVDADNRLQRAIVDDKLVRETRRCREAWHSLQELGGIHNSHADRVRAQQSVAPAAAPAEPAAPAAAESVAKAAPAEPAPPSDEPYIETPRCSSCNECIQINPRMFAYDETQQARIVDASVGSYRELVEAAENCQVAIIHPGKPKNPKEPGLDELLKRAEPFL